MIRALFVSIFFFLCLSPAQAVDRLTIDEANAAELNDLGRHAARRNDFKSAFRFFENGAKLGSPRALANLGLLHIRGSGVSRDRKKGLEMLKQASESGIARVIFLYGDELLSEVDQYRFCRLSGSMNARSGQSLQIKATMLQRRC